MFACLRGSVELMVLLWCFSSQVFAAQNFFGHASHAHSVRRWCWSTAVCSTGGAWQTREQFFVQKQHDQEHEHTSISTLQSGQGEKKRTDEHDVMVTFFLFGFT